MDKKYIIVNEKIICLNDLQKCFIEPEENAIIFQYIKGNQIITDSVNYENIKRDVNSEKQQIQKDFEIIQGILFEEIVLKKEFDELEEAKKYLFETLKEIDKITNNLLYSNKEKIKRIKKVIKDEK